VNAGEAFIVFSGVHTTNLCKDLFQNKLYNLLTNVKMTDCGRC